MDKINFAGTDGAAFQISFSDAELQKHTFSMGRTGSGRSMLIEADAQRRGISYVEAEKDWLPTDEERQASAERARAAKVKRDQRTAAVREAYWSATDSDSSEFSRLSDTLCSICGREATDAQVRKLFDMLPADVIGEGVKWGFTDTVVGDAIHAFVQENKSDVEAHVFTDIA